MTAQELINDSLTIAGKLGAGRGPNESESLVALRSLNSMLGNWATQRLTIPVIQIDEYELEADKQTYTIGDGGDIDVPRPVAIDRANLIDSNDHHRKLDVITIDNWANIGLPTLESTQPTELYYERSFPLGTIRLWPVPTATDTLELFTQQTLGKIETLNTVLEFVPDPPGYEEAVKYNLAIRLKGIFPKALTISNVQLILIQQIARESLGNIKRMNKVTPVLKCENIGSSARSTFDIRTG